MTDYCLSTANCNNQSQLQHLHGSPDLLRGSIHQNIWTGEIIKAGPKFVVTGLAGVRVCVRG